MRFHLMVLTCSGGPNLRPWKAVSSFRCRQKELILACTDPSAILSNQTRIPRGKANLVIGVRWFVPRGLIWFIQSPSSRKQNRIFGSKVSRLWIAFWTCSFA